MKLRVKFSKHGALKFIGHLDVMRFFQKAIRRAGIDITYTTGFSPHQVMSFAQPLGLGLESNGEYMDIEVNSITNGKDFMDALNAQMVEGIQILGVTLLPDNAENAMASVKAAEYHIRFREGYEPSFDVKTAIPAFMSQEQIEVTKKTKKSEINFDMKPYIFDFKMSEDGSYIILTVDCSSSGNLKPSLVMSKLFENNNQILDEYGLLITREETYTDNLLPLGMVGEVF